MESSHKVVVVLLVLAILFSTFALFVSMGVFSIELPHPGTNTITKIERPTSTGQSQINLVVEGGGG